MPKMYGDNGGDVVGPNASTDNTIARFDGVTGAFIQDSSATISDTGVGIFQTTTNNETGFRVLNAAGGAILDVNTTDASGGGVQRILKVRANADADIDPTASVRGFDYRQILGGAGTNTVGSRSTNFLLTCRNAMVATGVDGSSLRAQSASFNWASSGAMAEGNGMNTTAFIGGGNTVNAGAATLLVGNRIRVGFQGNAGSGDGNTPLTGSITQAIGFDVLSPNDVSVANSHPITTVQGLRIQDQRVTDVTNSFAIDIEDQSAGGYALRTGSGEVVFNESGADSDFRIESDTDDSMFFVDASADAIGMMTQVTSYSMNSVNVTPTLTMKHAGLGSTINQFLVAYSDTDTQGAFNVFGRARGTEASPTVVFDNDRIGIFRFDGHDGTEFIPASKIETFVDGVPSTGFVPGELGFSVNDGSTGPVRRMTIRANGQVGIGTSVPSSTNILDVRGAAIFNEGGDNVDFRVEGDTDQNLFKIKGSNDRVGIGTGSPLGKLQIQGKADEAQLYIKGHTTQTQKIMRIFDSSGSERCYVTNEGNLFTLGWQKCWVDDTNALQVSTASANEVLGVDTLTSASAGVNTVNITTAGGAQAGSANVVRGLNIIAEVSSGTQSNYLNGATITSKVTGTASKSGTSGDQQYALDFRAVHDSTGTNAEMYGVSGLITIGQLSSSVNTGLITAAYGMRFGYVFQTSGTAAVTDMYQMYVNSPAGGSALRTVTNSYGLKIDDQAQTGITNAYAIKTGTGLIELGDDVTVSGDTTLSGGLTLNRTAVGAGAYTTLLGDYIVAKTAITASGDTVTLESDTVIAGKVVIIKDESGNAGTDNITIATEGAETIDGQSTVLISADHGVVRLYSDGTDWFSF